MPQVSTSALVLVQLVSIGYAFHSQIFNQPQAYSTYVQNAEQGYYVPQASPGGPAWTVTNNGGVPTWIITTTEIETRNETSNTKDEDKIQDPNVKDNDSMMSSDEEDEGDLEFPIVHGTDPVVHARPAFSDVDKYEEDQQQDEAANKTKSTLVTVNRTTVVKIEFVNSAYLPLVLQVGNLPQKQQQEPTTDDSKVQPSTTNYSKDQESTGQSGITVSTATTATNNNNKQDQQGQASDRTEQVIQRTLGQPNGVPQIVPGFSFPGNQFVQPAFYYSPYGRFWKRK